MKAALVITPIENVNENLEVIDKLHVTVIIRDWRDPIICSNGSTNLKKESTFVENQVSCISLSQRILYNSKVHAIIHMYSSNDTDELEKFADRFTPKKFRIDCWIPAEVDDPQIYDDIDDAKSELRQLQDMQPENIYQILVHEK